MTTALKPTRLPYNFAKANGVVALKNTDNTYTVYHLASPDYGVLAEINRAISPQSELILKEVNNSDFQRYLTQCYQSQSSVHDAAIDMETDSDLAQLAGYLPNSEDLLDRNDDAPIIRLLNALFTQAIKQKASDIHIETYENRVLVRNRIDGVLHEVLDIQRGIAPLVISRVKVMAKLDIAEKRLPQDGRIALRIGGHNIDVRVSTLPSNHGERVVLRILDKQSAELNLSLLGMPAATLKTAYELIAQPHGIILVTGPTGSGKTTSLYAMLTELNEVRRNILTIEDPIEYDLPGVGQTQVNSKVNMTFARGLRAILRQDPDIVMIGEIRDLETAEIAVQASLTGHLVLSTLHTNSALGAIARLKDMGVESFLLASSIIGLIAQRLVRKLCEHCKVVHILREDEKELMGNLAENIPEIYQPKGCELCNHLGYRGRTGIYELIVIDETLRAMIHRHENPHDIEAYLRLKTATMRQDGFKHVLAGQTSLSEILRVTSLS